MTRSAFLPAAVLLLAGCMDARVYRCPCAERMTATGNVPPDPAGYRLGCPDVLAVAFADRPDWDCVASVDVDGRLPLGEAGRPAVAGLNLDEAHAEVAKAAGLPQSRVTVELAEPRAGRVYVVGPENGRQRAVPFWGPEPAVEFLWRVGALQPGCSDLRDVSVIRPNIAAGGPPTIHEVNVEAVVLHGDHRTNLVLQPSDEVVVGETKRSSIGRLLPDWFKPLYAKLLRMLPPDGWFR